MPNLTRRLFLGHAGTAATAAGIPVAVAAAPAQETVPAALAAALDAARIVETPELLTIGAELPLARQRYSDALAALDAARELALKLAPPIPEGLPVPFGISVFGSMSWHCLPSPTDIVGNAIELPRFVNPKSGKALPVKIPRASDILSDRRSCISVPSWQRGEHRRLYDLAVEFEAAQDHACEASGLNEAEWEIFCSKQAIIKACRAAGEIDAKTVLGILIKAQTIAACQEIDDESARSAAFYASQPLAAATCATLRNAA